MVMLMDEKTTESLMACKSGHHQLLCLLLVAVQLWQPFFNFSYAGEVVPSSAGTSLKQSANGAPVVNIAKPGAAGISHNTYTQFDVNSKGLILNNSAQPVNTQLGGYVMGNANVAGASARLILNEVTAANPSQLNGYMEVAGQKADVIVANPWGISCKGCGFINTARATLSTGKPFLNNDGSLAGFDVQGGTLRIDGDGLNASNTERLALYARVLELNAALYAKDLQMLAGSNRINANGSYTAQTAADAAPTYSIDSSALGGMYANTITLMGTEAGVGMRLSGPVAALTGKLEITSNGDVRLVQASAAQSVAIKTAGNLEIAGQGDVEKDGIHAGQAVNLEVGHALRLSGRVTGQATTLHAEQVVLEAGSRIEADGSLSVTASRISLPGAHLLSRGDMTLTLDDFDLEDAGGSYESEAGLTIRSHGNIRMAAMSFRTPGSLTLDAAHALTIENRLEAGQAISLQAEDIRMAASGFVAAQGDLESRSINLNNLGLIFSAGDLLIEADSISNGRDVEPVQATLLAQGDIRLSGRDGTSATSISNLGGRMESQSGDITLKALTVSNRNIGWTLADAWSEDLLPKYWDDCPHNIYCAGYQQISNFMYSGGFICCYVAGESDPALILFESNFYWPRNAKWWENIWLHRQLETVTHHDIANSGQSASIIAGRSSGVGGNIFITADVLDNDRSTLSAAARLDIDARVIRNTATALQDGYFRQLDHAYKECPNDGNCWRVNGPHQEFRDNYISRTDQIISAVIEGVSVDLHETDIINAQDGVLGSLQKGPPTATGYDNWHGLPLAGPEGFVLPDSPLYHINPPSHPYLVETDPALNTYAGFLGSGYLIGQLSWQPGVTQRRLGDSYYELTLIRDALLASIGSRFLSTAIADEKAQYEYLMQNAIAASESLHLTPGISLSREQIDALQQDIVWMEERNIAGEKVLVPIVYLAGGSSRLLRDGAVIGGGNLAIEAGTVENAGLIRASDSLAIKTQHDINNRGRIVAGDDLALQSGGDILNESGQLRGNNVLLLAAGDITHRTLSQGDDSTAGGTQSWSTRIGETASVEANGQLVQIAGGDIHLTAATLKGGNVALEAGHDIILDTLKNEQGYRYNSSDWQAAEEHVRYLGSQIEAANDISLRAGQDITAIAASLKADGNIALAAQGNIALLAANNSDHTESHSQGHRYRSDDTTDDTQALVTQITAGGTLTTVAGNNFIAEGAALKGEGIDLAAGNQVLLLAAYDSHSETHSSSKKGYLTQEQSQSAEQSITAKATSLNAGEGGIVIMSKGDATLQGTRLISGAGIAITSIEGKVLLAATKDILLKQSASSGDNGLVAKMETASTHNEAVNMVQMESRVAPIISAAQGIQIDVKESAGASTENIKTVLAALEQQPGMEWLKTMQAKGEIDYSKIQEIAESQHESSKSIGMVASIVVAVAVTVATAGAGSGAGAAVAGAAGATGTTVGVAMAGATTALVSSAAVTSSMAAINSALNGEGLGGVYDRLATSEVGKSLLTSLVTGGVTAGISQAVFGIDPTGTMTTNPATMPANPGFDLTSLNDIGKQLTYNLAMSTSGALVDSALNDTDLKDNLQQALRTGSANTVGAIGFYQGANFAQSLGMEEGSFGRALMHAGTGAAVGGISNGDAAGGAAGAFVTALAAPALGAIAHGHDNVTLALGEISGAVGAALVTGSAEAAATGQSVGRLETQYNYLSHRDVDDAAKRLRDCRNDRSCEEKVNQWVGQRDRENSAALAACQTDACRQAHAIAIAGGNRALLDEQNASLSLQGLHSKIVIMNSGDAVKLPSSMMALGTVVAFVQTECGGAWSDVCHGKWDTDQARKSTNAKALVAALYTPAAMAVGAEGLLALRACLGSVICVNQLGMGGADLLAGEATGGASLVGGAVGMGAGAKAAAGAMASGEQKIAKQIVEEALKTSNAGGINIRPEILALSEKNITESGITILGRFQAPPGQMNYIEKATVGKYEGASYFDLGDMWTPVEGKAANLHFLDVVGGRGDKMIFSTPKGQIQAGTSLDMEVKYLKENFGYEWVNQWSMQKRVK